MPLPVLDATEQRIVGCLLEKQRTVPASYPLSLNSLRLACNQTSSRDPVLTLDDQTVEAAARELKARGLLRIVWAGKGARTLKYHQLLDEVLSLPPDERALLTVLLLRGPQAPGELKTRTDRLYPFTDRDQVEQVLHRMAALPEPLVIESERRPGQQDHRWVHLLGPVPEPSGSAATSAVDREVVLADGPAARDRRVRDSYDRVAQAYLEAFRDELAGKPFDSWLLTRLAGLADSRPVVEVGCGPGQIAGFLADRGATVSAIDLSPEMIAVAIREYPEVDFSVGNLAALLKPRTAPGWGAVVAWYALIHLAGSELATTISSLARTLAPGGVLAVAVHLGERVDYVTEWFGEPVDLVGVRHDPDQVLAAFAAAGLVGVEWYRRGPSGTELPTERLYVLGWRDDQP